MSGEAPYRQATHWAATPRAQILTEQLNLVLESLQREHSLRLAAEAALSRESGAGRRDALRQAIPPSLH